MRTLVIAATVLAAGFGATQASAANKPAVFAGGCFWSVE